MPSVQFEPEQIDPRHGEAAEPAGDRLPADEDLLDDQAKGERRDREIGPGQPQDREGHEHADHRGEQGGKRHRDHERHAMVRKKPWA